MAMDERARRALQVRVEEALAPIRSGSIRVHARNGRVQLVGWVYSEADRDRAEVLALRVPGVVEVENLLSVEGGPPQWEDPTTSPDRLQEDLSGSPRGAMPVETAGVPEIRERPTEEVGEEEPGTEPDFEDMVGTTSEIEAVEEAEPYLPPTDTVMEPADEAEEGVEVVGGVASTSMEELAEPYVSSLGPERGDEEITADVIRELREDAATSGFSFQVFTVNGVVYLRGRVPSLEFADAAEDVARRVPGVRDVREEIEVEGLG